MLECKIPHYINQKGQISLTREPAWCTVSSSPSMQSVSINPVKSRTRHFNSEPSASPLFQISVHRLNRDCMSCWMTRIHLLWTAPFPSLAQFPTSLCSFKYLLLLGKPTGCHQRALVCSQNLEPVMGKSQTNGGEGGALLMSDGSSLSVFTVQQIMAPQALASPVS